jgi:N-acetylneuraminic acid mutarotase
VGADGKIYAYGGYVRDAAGLRQYGVGEYSLVIYDPKSDHWSRGPKAPKYRGRSRQTHARGFFAEDGTLQQEFFEKERIGEQRPVHELVTGTANPLGRPHWLNRSAWIWFDVEKGRWEHPAVLPLWVDNPDFDRENSPVGPRIAVEAAPQHFRYSGTIATGPGGLAYVTGGTGRTLNHPVERPKTLSASEVYDAGSGEWRSIAPLGNRRWLHAAAVDRQGRLFVFGGHQAEVSVTQQETESYESFRRRGAQNSRQANLSLASVEMYDPETDSWFERAPMPTPRQAMGAALGADGRIYVVGGAHSYSNSKPLSVVEIYDPAADTWSKGPPLAHPRRGHQVVATPEGRIYAIGGWVARRTPRRPLESVQVDRKLGASVEMLDTRGGP